MQAIEVDPRDVAALQPITTAGEYLVVILQVVLGQRLKRLGLQCLDKGRAQREEEGPDGIGLRGCRDGGRPLGAVAPQLALVFALMQANWR